MNQSIRVHSPATATPAMRTPKEVAYRLKGTTLLFNASFRRYALFCAHFLREESSDHRNMMLQLLYDNKIKHSTYP